MNEIIFVEDEWEDGPDIIYDLEAEREELQRWFKDFEAQLEEDRRKFEEEENNG